MPAIHHILEKRSGQAPLFTSRVPEDQGDIRVQDPSRHHQGHLRGSAGIDRRQSVPETMKRPTQRRGIGVN